jgi:tetratricopeptide (TPR) repeat protein
VSKRPGLTQLFLIAIVLIAAQNSFAQIKFDSLRNLLNRNDDTVKVNIMNAISSGFLTVQSDSALTYAKSAVRIAKKIEFKKGEFNGLANLHKIYNSRDDNRNMLFTNQRAVTIAHEIGDLRLIAISKGRLGITYRYLNYDVKAFENLKGALDNFIALGDKKNAATFSISTGNIYLNTGDHDTAKKYYQQAIVLSSNDPETVARVDMTLGDLYYREKKLDESLSRLNNAIDHFTKTGNDVLLAYSFILKGEVFYELDRLDQASEYVIKSLELYRKLKNPGKEAECLIDLGNIALRNSQPREALAHFSKALSVLKYEQKKYEKLKMIYVGLVKTYSELGDYKSALENERMVSLCADSLNSFNRTRQIDELKVRTEVDLAEREIIQLQADKRKQYTIIGLLGLLILFGTVIINMVLKKNKERLNTSESGKKHLEVQLEAKEKTESLLKNELEFKVKELTSFTLNMIKKKEAIQTVKESLEEIRNQTDGEVRNQLNKIVSTINFSQHVSNDWDSFRLYFDQVNQGFFDNLRSAYPQLNPKDLKVCALIRLNIDTKQIASILDISPESVKIARHRLRKKLGITKEESLTTFFSTFTTSNQSLEHDRESVSIIDTLLNRHSRTTSVAED